jgi:hypothetical protein
MESIGAAETLVYCLNESRNQHDMMHAMGRAVVADMKRADDVVLQYGAL